VCHREKPSYICSVAADAASAPLKKQDFRVAEDAYDCDVLLVGSGRAASRYGITLGPALTFGYIAGKHLANTGP
jgi:hypothetical protein